MKISFILLFFLATLNSYGQTADSIAPIYCTVNESTSSCYANVTEIKFGEINNSVFHARNGYYDYLDMQTELKPGQTILMTVSFDRYSMTSDNIIGGEIYIDFNIDGDFDDENEMIFQDLNINGKATYSFPVHIPENANLGLTRLRTRADDDTYNNIGPCGYAEETQDYSLIISKGSTIVTPSNVTAKVISSNKILLIWNDNSLSELSYLIERSNDSINFDKNYLIGQNTIEFVDSNLVAGEKYFYRIAAIADSDTSEYSEIISARTLLVDFNKVRDGDLVTNKNFTVGAFWGDYNNDGKQDIFTSGDNILYSNLTEMFNNSALSFKSSGSASWGDYNNDGNLDIFITSYNYSFGTPFNNILYRNNGNNSFTEIIPFETDGRVSNCVWLDFNNDGKLDIFLSYLDLNYGKLYLNKGNDIFEEVLEFEGASGFSNFIDYDNDGDLDLFVAKYNNNILYDNNGDGTFSPNQNSLLTLSSSSSNGASWGDIDNDGDMDLFLANGGFGNENNSLFINLGNGSFYQNTIGDIVNDGGDSYGSSFCDIDNDGNLDLVVANFQQNNFLYMGNGDGTFKRINQSIIENEFLDSFLNEIPSIGCSFGDYNNDGFSDLIIANSGAENFLYENSGNQNNWIKLKLIGTQSNKSAFGTKIQLITGGNSQFREIISQTGFGGQNELTVNFGLSNKSEIDSIIVQWPSGIKQVLTDILSNQTLEIVETNNNTSVVNTRKDIEFIVYPNPAKNQITILGINELKISTIELLDINGRVLVSKKTFDNILSIDISEFPNGIYLLKTVIDGSVKTTKIIKQ